MITVPGKPQTHSISDLSQLPAALRPLTRELRWVVWPWEYRTNKGGTGKWTKPPRMAKHPSQNARSNDPSTWGSFEDAVAAVVSGQADGIGFMLLGSGIGAVDLDHCLHPELPDDQWCDPWAKELWAEIPAAYHEKTVSNTGARIIGIVDPTRPEIGRKFAISGRNGAGIEIYRNTARYITISGLQFGSCRELPSIDDFLEGLLAKHLKASARLKMPAAAGSGNGLDGADAASKSVGVNGGSSSGSTIDLNKAGPQRTEQEKFEEILQNGVPEGERSEAFQSVVWHLARKGLSVEEIVRELEKHPHGIGAKYIGRLAGEVERSFLKYRSKRQSEAVGSLNGGAVSGIVSPGTGSGGPPPPGSVPPGPGAGVTGGSGVGPSPPGGWPQVRLVAGEMPRVVNEAESALLSLGCEFYRYGNSLVRPVLTNKKASDGRETVVWQLMPITVPYLRETLARAAQFMRWSPKKKVFATVDVPKDVAETYLARHGEWRMRILNGIVNTPFLRQDGSICEKPGYDEASGLLFKPEITFPSIPLSPTREDALKALKYLHGLIRTFPFVVEKDGRNVSRAIHLAGVLTALTRRLMSSAPLICYTAPTAGTGKSLLVDLISLIAVGSEMPVISQGHNEEELEKRLTGELIDGSLAISIDNCNRPLESVLLCQMLSQREVKPRILGKSKNPLVPSTAAVYATGNNLVLNGIDLIRRSLMSRIDARCDRPETRSFNFNIKNLVLSERAKIVPACLIILRAWHLVCERETGALGLLPFGSFDEWSLRVRAPLVWLGEADPCSTQGELAAGDPQRIVILKIMGIWERVFGFGRAMTIKEIVDASLSAFDLQLALLEVAIERGSRMVSHRRLGSWLAGVKDRVIDDKMIAFEGVRDGYPRYSLQKV